MKNLKDLVFVGFVVRLLMIIKSEIIVVSLVNIKELHTGFVILIFK